MFAGIIKSLGTLESTEKKGSNLVLSISSPLSSELSIDQSVAHNGVCLTVIDSNESSYKVVAIQETLDRTNLGEMNEGDLMNLELCVTANQKIDGHFVQGHVDAVGQIRNIEEVDGSWYLTISFPREYASLLVDKGSVCINGISLTVIEPTEKELKVAIIPYTYEHTNLNRQTIGSKVNLEFDILGKYINRRLDLQQK